MRKLIYSMGVSLDGFIAGPGGEIDWSAPDEERHRFHNQQTRELGALLCGRRPYEEMLFWETADQNASLGEPARQPASSWVSSTSTGCSSARSCWAAARRTSRR